jgi:hypothetical protein
MFEAPPEARHVRGITLVSARKLARKLAARAGVRLAGIRIPHALECQHFLIAGSTGSGKSVAIRSLLRQIEKREETAVVVDPECEFVSEFYQPGRGDLVLNPLDARCPRWSPWYELRDESHDADCEALPPRCSRIHPMLTTRAGRASSSVRAAGRCLPASSGSPHPRKLRRFRVC